MKKPTPFKTIPEFEEDEKANNRTPSCSTPKGGRALSLMGLPTELHLQIASYLTYPDALSLKHTNHHFYSFVYTGVNLKIEWLIERRRLHLDCPHDKGCELGSDTRFCRGSVRLLMKRRREHGECEIREGGRGCLVFGTKICTFRREKLGKWGLLREKIGIMIARNELAWWISCALFGLVLALGLNLLRAGAVPISA